VGAYNLQNLLAAAAVGLALDMDPAEIAAGLESCQGVPGRLQRVGGAEVRPAVFVDYAHTDDALKQVLGALKPLTKGRLICVFGAGGDRDHGKRPLMGQAVGKGADAAVLTSDNPRTEDPAAIMAMIEPGLKEAGMRGAERLGTDGVYLTQPDRARAIALAIAEAADDDVVLIAGKGHEDYQIVGHEKRHFDDCEQAAAALKLRAGEAGHA
jgi:UDP-N-acetylmuramoyl-L-alanyl-D-glutamate--2,6-diaminopimelate ligase